MDNALSSLVGLPSVWPTQKSLRRIWNGTRSRWHMADSAMGFTFWLTLNRLIFVDGVANRGAHLRLT
jgi:hypothetical protein